MAPSRQGARRRPEVRDRHATVEHGSTGVILDGVDVEENPKWHTSLPLIWAVLSDAHLGGEATRGLVGKGEPQHLGNAMRIQRPDVHPEGAGVLHGGEAGIEALHSTLPAEDVIDDVRLPRERRQAVDIQVHPVEHVW
jgi:hypothetical protein